MHIYDKELRVPIHSESPSYIDIFRETVASTLSPKEWVIRFVVTDIQKNYFNCEVSVLLVDSARLKSSNLGNFFTLRRRQHEMQDKFNAVMIVPTGTDCAVGGHAGDATPSARLLATVCDSLILNPNVVNASDINEMPENSLYVEGSVITRLLLGTIGLRKVRANRIILVADQHRHKLITESTINCGLAARSTLGADIAQIVVVSNPMEMKIKFSQSGCSAGQVNGLDHLCNILDEYKGLYDAIALSSYIQLPDDAPASYVADYFKNEIQNPWGGVEAMLTHAVSSIYNIPSAHAPLLGTPEEVLFDIGIVDPRKAAESISRTFLFSVLKGLNKSPAIVSDPMFFHQNGILTVEHISCLIVPDKCIGIPTFAALEQGIPVIAVKENSSLMKGSLENLGFPRGKLFFAENYVEAAGIMTALKSGIELGSLRRPFQKTKIDYK